MDITQAKAVINQHRIAVSKEVAELLRKVVARIEGEKDTFEGFGYPQELAQAYANAQHFINVLDPPKAEADPDLADNMAQTLTKA